MSEPKGDSSSKGLTAKLGRIFRTNE